MIPESCATFFSSCADKFKNMSWDMFWKMLIATDANGCPAVRTTAVISGPIAFTPSSNERPPSRVIVSAVGAGSVPAGARSINIELSSDFTGSLDGDDTITGMLTPGGSYNWAVNQNDDFLGELNYEILTGRIAIQKVG